jgi:hypothetical protein
MNIYYSAISVEFYNLPKINLLYAFNNKVKRIEKPLWCKKLFIDSGGYVAWKSGKKIDLDKYHDFIYLNKDIIEVYAALDEVEDYKKSMDLYNESLSCGFNPIPIYHEEDPEFVLKDYMNKSDYIGFAAINKLSRNKKKRFLNNCFDIITDDYKVHGFGFMDTDIITSYPFYSVDGTYPFRLARFGGILTPFGSYKFNKEEMDRWYKGLLKIKMDKYIKGKFDIELLKSYEKSGMIERLKANIYFFENLEPKENKQGELF